MTIDQILQDKSVKAKGKVIEISERLVKKELHLDEILAFAQTQNSTDKATCIEAIEYATKKSRSVANENLLNYVTNALLENEPRIKWESAKVIGNIAKLFPNKLANAIHNLVDNAKNKQTVVRWATAFALGEILKLKTTHHDELLVVIEDLCLKEADNGVKKKYLDALIKLNT